MLPGRSQIAAALMMVACVGATVPTPTHAKDSRVYFMDCQEGPCPKNGMAITGIAPSLDMMDCEAGPCPKNGSEITGIARASLGMLDCEAGPCPRNGTERTGVASQVALPVTVAGSTELVPQVTLPAFDKDSSRGSVVRLDTSTHFISSLIAANGTKLTGIARETVTSRPRSAPQKRSANGPLLTGIAEDAQAVLKTRVDRATVRLARAEYNRPLNVASWVECDDFLCTSNGTSVSGVVQDGAIDRDSQTLQVDGTEFVLTLPDGRRLRSADLVGATLEIPTQGSPLEILISSVEDDAQAIGGRVVLHRFMVQSETGAPIDLCTADADGRHLGFPVPDGRGGFEVTCTSGAIGKCIRWGYRPWDESEGGPPLHALHRACVRMTRADYGGDGRTHTRDGTKIGIHDRFAIRHLHRDPRMAFEAAWGVDGAICVAHPRVANEASIAQLGARYPQLASRLGAAACSFEQALRDPAALLFNWSYL